MLNYNVSGITNYYVNLTVSVLTVRFCFLYWMLSYQHAVAN